jgi:hypothetical protein
VGSETCHKNETGLDEFFGMIYAKENEHGI